MQSHAARCIDGLVSCRASEIQGRKLHNNSREAQLTLQVRVESLFIDEGFGSHNVDTPRDAMDTLDGLQAMGRKVGVISHGQEMTERIATRVLVERVAVE
ncbi:Exonuclease SbcC [Oxalobacteraceae bacterium IMCC9480]|nr:Exonuclease SbcC [Oxalobacteraceae bacterium IMCC9480]NDP60772.1 hypothetical protein [Oxalobacteraceae bacterium]